MTSLDAPQAAQVVNAGACGVGGVAATVVKLNPHLMQNFASARLASEHRGQDFMKVSFHTWNDVLPGGPAAAGADQDGGNRNDYSTRLTDNQLGPTLELLVTPPWARMEQWEAPADAPGRSRTTGLLAFMLGMYNSTPTRARPTLGLISSTFHRTITGPSGAGYARRATDVTMRTLAAVPHLARIIQVTTPVLFALVLIGLGLDWLPAGWIAALLILAFLLPFCWPRQAGSWPGVLLLVGLSWIPVWGMRVNALSNRFVAVLLLLMLSALAASPGSIVLLIRRRSASVAVMLLGFALFPCLLSVLLARIGPPPLDSGGASAAATVSNQLAWLPGMWYPLLGMCLGSVGFAISLGWLLVREARRMS